MKNFSDLIKENNENKTFTYTAEVMIKVTGTVVAESEGDAGYIVDNLLQGGNKIEGEIVDNGTAPNMEINEIPTEFSENILNEEPEETINTIYDTICSIIETNAASMNDYNKAMFFEKLRINLQNK